MTYENEAVLFPVADLYDQGAMQMYIQAAKDQYDRGQKAIDDFVAKYGDFTSPIAADVEYWDNNTMTPIIDMYDEYVRNGIDPVRNPEARNALMARARKLPYAKLAAIRQNAEDAREYRKAQQKLIQEGKYDNRFAKYDNVDLSTFRTIGDDGNVNTIGQLSPTPMLPIGQFANPFFGDIKPRITKTTSGGVTTESEVLSAQDIQRYTEYVLPQILATPQGSMMYRRAVGEYKNNGYDDDTADSMALEDLRDNIAASQSWRIKNNTEYNDYSNQYKIDDYRTRNDDWLDQQKSARDSYYSLITAGADTDGDGKISNEERQNYATLMQNSRKYSGSKTDGGENVFRRSERTIDSSAGADYENIQPKVSGITHTVNKDGSTYYTIPAGIAGSVLYSHDSVYDNQSNSLIRYNEFAQKQGNYYFKPTGTMKAKKIIDSKGVEHTRYFITGTLQHQDFESDITDGAGSPKIYEMEVTESVNKHGKNQRKK